MQSRSARGLTTAWSPMRIGFGDRSTRMSKSSSVPNSKDLFTGQVPCFEPASRSSVDVTS